MAFTVKIGKRSVPKGREQAKFVRGSRPPSLSSPRIKPLASGASGTRLYGKATEPIQPGSGGFGQTGLTGET